MNKILLVLALLAGSGAAAELRGAQSAPEAELGDHLDLEVLVEGRRELFPLLPGTRCPTGHKCRARNAHKGMSPLMAAMKDNMRDKELTPQAWQALNNNLLSAVDDNDHCSRRSAMARAAGLAAGLALATVSAPAYAAQTVEVKMGSDSGGLQFVPAKSNICKGDSITWVNNKGGPHNVVFDEDAIPAGVSQEAISMDSQLGEEGDTFSMKFDVAGNYAYYCEPHRGAGMNGALVVA